tara:strand:- start:446 stop:1699 length:1254 start_codon:yes stop_codon:yes gene_type:complete
MINRILSSDKLNRTILTLRNIPNILLDLLLISYAVVNNLVKYRKLYKEDISIVTASDNIFFDSLLQLIKNLYKFEENLKITVYDIGLEISQKSKLLSDFKNVDYKKFNFSDYPNFLSERDEYKKLGYYAWKSVIIHDELTELKNQVIWFDSGNLITKKITLVRIVLTAYGIFSPISNGTIKEWTHSETLKYLQVPKEIENKRNLTGGIVGLDWSNKNARKISEDWKNYSTKKECIAPEGSDRSNHRQDQSILSILRYKDKKIKAIPKNKKLFGLKVNQNPGIKIYLSDSYKNKKRKKLKEDWLKENFEISTNTIKASDIVWILDLQDISKISNKIISQKKVFAMIDKENIKNFKDNIDLIKNNVTDIDYLIVKSEEKEYVLSQLGYSKYTIFEYKNLPELKRKMINFVYKFEKKVEN